MVVVVVVLVKGESDRSEGCERKMKVSNYKEEEKKKGKREKKKKRKSFFKKRSEFKLLIEQEGIGTGFMFDNL